MDQDPGPLVQTDWLEARLQDPGLRIFDCTTHLMPPAADTGRPYRIVSGRAGYDRGHVPGAGFLDLQGELSDDGSRFAFMLPSAERFASAMSRHGVGDGVRVVLYSAGSIMWATRVWWMLRAFGFDDAAVLDGGWEKWCAEGRPVSTEPDSYRSTVFTPRPRAGLFVGKETVLAALDDGETCIVNALGPHFHRGETPSRYGRPGRIPNSVNMPAASLLDPQTHAFVPLVEARARFHAAGVKPAGKVLAYCGGGISATVDLFVLHRLGYEHLALYDASMGEWARDETLPMERG